MNRRGMLRSAFIATAAALGLGRVAAPAGAQTRHIRLYVEMDVPPGREREMLQALIDKSQEHVEGEVRLKLYKGNVAVVGRVSKYSLYDQDLVTFEEGAVAYDHRDAQGFIRLNALRLRTLGMRRKKFDK